MSRFNRVLAAAIWAVDAFVVATVLYGANPDRALVAVPGAAVAVIAWVALWRPTVSVDADRVRVVNVLRTIDIPWAALIRVDTRYALTLYTPGRRFTAWAAPAPGRTGTSLARRAERNGRVAAAPRQDGEARPGDLMASESGQAAAIVRDMWERLREDGTLAVGVADTTPIAVRWHWASGGAAVLLSGAAVWALLALRL